MKKIIYLLFLYFIFFSCKKENDEPPLPHTIAEGYVIHSGTKQPLDSVRVSIWNGMPCSDPLGCDKNNEMHFYDTSYTDKNGYFRIEIDGYEPVMFLYKKDYSFEYRVQGAVIGIIPLLEGENRNLKFEMDAPAGFDPTFINKFKNSDDLLKFSDYAIDSFNTKYGIETTVYWEHKGFEPFRPNKNDASIAIGDKYHLYMLEITRNGNKQTIVDSVYIKSFTTFTDTIYY